MVEQFDGSTAQVFGEDLSKLTARQLQIYKMHLGLDGNPPMSFSEIARQISVDKRSISRTFDRACYALGYSGLEENDGENAQPSDSGVTDQPWHKLASGLSIEEIEVLEMSLGGFSEAKIGSEAGIGGYHGTRALKKELSQKFDVPLEELITVAPFILRLALSNRSSDERVQD